VKSGGTAPAVAGREAEEEEEEEEVEEEEEEESGEGCRCGGHPRMGPERV